jgi:hypothetical protein
MKKQFSLPEQQLGNHRRDDRPPRLYSDPDADKARPNDRHAVMVRHKKRNCKNKKVADSW